MSTTVFIYTDGSCHTQLRIGAWASIILLNNEKITLCGQENDTTHNRMEILAVIHSILYVKKHFKEINSIHIVSDSQYVIGLIGRESKFIANEFLTKAGNEVRNIDIVKELLNLVSTMNIKFEKIKAHQKATDEINFNIEVDKICRGIVRETVNKTIKKALKN
ncbi:MAG: ribonuclease H [Bacteroidota bacterium]